MNSLFIVGELVEPLMPKGHASLVENTKAQ